MPGYLIHLASCGGQTLNNRSFVLGVEAPDLLKKQFKNCFKRCGNLNDAIVRARVKYETLRTSEMPRYGELISRILEQETANSTAGLHFGLSSKPDVNACWSGLTGIQKANPFYRGYVWHLLTDAIVYSRLDIDSKFENTFASHVNDPNFDQLRENAIKDLHSDWDKINSHVRALYPEIIIPNEVVELGVIKFTEGQLLYVDWEIIKDTIEYLRKFNPLEGDMEDIITTIMNKI